MHPAHVTTPGPGQRRRAGITFETTVRTDPHSSDAVVETYSAPVLTSDPVPRSTDKSVPTDPAGPTRPVKRRRTSVVVVHPPRFVPMSDEERQVAVHALTALVVAHIRRHGQPPVRGDRA